MIKNNCFFLNKIKNIVVLGELHQNIKKINDDLSLKTHLITSPSFKLKNKIVNTKVFSELNKAFENYIKDNFNIDETLFVSFGPRWIFKKNIINKLLKNNLVNFHCTRLPLDAGGAGISWRIMRNDRLGNCLVHLVDCGVDTGPILENYEFIFSKNCKTPKDFENENNIMLHNFYKKFIKDLKSEKKFNIQHQTQYLRRYNPRLNTEINGWINWFNSSNEIYNFINAFDDPFPGASTFIGKKKVRLKDVHLHGGEVKGHSFSSGLITRKSKNWIVVATTDSNHLIIEKVLNFKNHNILENLNEGDRFYTPVNQLVAARSDRVFYKSTFKKSFIKR